MHGQAKTREVQGQLEALQGGAGGGGNGELKPGAPQQQPGGGGGDDPTADEFTDKNRFFASNAAGRGDAPGGEGELGYGEATTTSSAGVKAMRSEIDRLRRAVSDDQAASATLRARMRMLEAAAGGSTPRGGQPSAPRTPPHAHGGTGDGRDDDELEQLREENAALVGDVEAAQQDADAAAATARLVGAQLERARTVLVAEQGRVRTLEAALETQRGKAVALARLMRMQVQAAANGKHVDWPAVDALAAAATAPVALADDSGSADTSFDVDTAVGDDVHTAAHAPHRRPLPASGGAPTSSPALEQQYAALRAAYTALQRKHEGLQHSETLLCAALTAAHSALDSQQQQQQRHGGGSASGRATPSPAHSPRTARRQSNSSKAGGGSPVFGSSVTSREEALSAALQSERAAAAAAEAHLQRELGDLQRKASALSYELAALKAVQSRSDILSNGHADTVYAAGQDHAAGRIGLRQRRPAGRNGDSGSDASSGDEDDQERDAHAVRHQLAAARAELRDLGVALRLALTSGVSEYAAALASVDDISTAAAASRGSDAALALKATLARYLVHSSTHGGGGEVDALGGAPDSGLHAAAALEAARQEAADAEARALAAEAECVALRRKLGTEQMQRPAEATSDRAAPVATTAAAEAPAPAEPVHEERVPRAYDGVPAADVAVQEAPTASADADAEPTPAVAPHAPPPPPPVAAAAPLPGPSQPVVLKAKPLPRVWPKAQPPPEAEDAPTAAASGDDGADTDGSSGDVPARETKAVPQLRVRTSRSARWAAQSGTGAT